MDTSRSNAHLYTTFRGSTFILVITFFILVGNVSVDCRRSETMENKDSVIKTVEGDGGDVIDCIDIYKQPALNHPLLKNHTIQLNPPSTFPNGTNETEMSHQNEILQSWLLNGECPEGTIPILRTQAFNNSVPKSTPPPFNGSDVVEFTPARGHEYTIATLLNGQYYGAHAYFNVWSPLTVNEDFSLSQIWVMAAHGIARSTVEAGWKVTSPDKQTRFFTFWTGHGYQDGCYNHECPGFVQVSRKFALGAAIKPVSSYKGKQFDIFISIYKHQSVGQWWLMLNHEPLGYWPDRILPTLRGSADAVSWGGEIYISESGCRHTTTQMGSGHFPSEDYGRASYIRNIQYLASSGKFVDASPQELTTYATAPSCYNLSVREKSPTFGTHFYYGGPGYSATCPR